ncbi:hypothetical protein ACF07Y_38920 [Streptomyces sp. NPDC016566]|uniref:hypothetical protein n=1 Tax=Streptomyces sp. NPDC016566 TaxID=3364967 RepID=UPI0036FBC521
MNWSDLLEASLVVGMVLPLLVRVLGLLSTTRTLAIQIAVLTVSTVWAFLQGDADDTVLFASLNIVLLLVLCRYRGRRGDKGRACGQDRPREKDRVSDSTTVKP